jgi:hypothetical protein
MKVYRGPIVAPGHRLKVRRRPGGQMNARGDWLRIKMHFLSSPSPGFHGEAPNGWPRGGPRRSAVVGVPGDGVASSLARPHLERTN